MHGHADRTSRIVLAVIGGILIVIGGAGIAATTGAFASGFAHRTLLANPGATWIGGHSAWFWPLATALLVVLALLSVRWLAAVLSPPPTTRDISIDGSARTTLGSNALREALTTEIEGYRGVDAARVRVHGDPQSPRLGVRVTLTDDANVARVRDRIEQEALAHARESLDAPTMPVTLDLAVSTHTGRRVD